MAEIASQHRPAVDLFQQNSQIAGATTNIQNPRIALRKLRALVPFTRLVQVIHVTGPDSLGEAEDAAPLVDAILLDSGNPNAAQRELGGTGRTHDWSVSAAIRAGVAPVPLLLAGGLRGHNVGEAIRQVQPFGVDVCSGVRTDGILDAGKLGAFVRAARGPLSS